MIIKNRISKIVVFDPKLIPNIDLWMFDLNHLTTREVTQASCFLNYTEQKRAQQFVFDLHRHHFIVRRMLLKVILARYVNTTPGLLQIIEDAYKKPYVDYTRRIHFSVSHVDTLGIVAIHSDRPVGFDIELLRPIEDRSILLEQFASADEYHWVNNSFKRFLMLWTIKEALLKCQGTGFLIDQIPQLDQIPTAIESDTLTAKYRNFCIYSRIWNKHVISICS